MLRNDAEIVTPPPRYQPLVVVAVAMAAGIFIDRSAPLAWTWTAAGSLIALALWGLLRKWNCDRAACASLLLSVCCMGASWHHLRWSCFDVDDIGVFAREEFSPAIVEGVAREAPRRVAAPPFDPMNAIPRGERSRLELDVLAIRDGDAWRPSTGRALLTVDGALTGIEAGDRLRVIGALAAPSPPLNPGNFSYADYLRAERIRAAMFAEHPAAVALVAPAAAYDARRWLGRVRALGEQDLARFLAPRNARLASALLLNAREQLESARTDAFLETGAIHHLAISGTHVGILAATLFLVLRLGMLPRKFVLALIAGIVVLYGFVTGGEAPVLRAVVLVVIICMALQFGRRPLGFNSLGAAGVCVLIWNPAELFDVGAQLSFLSVAVLVHTARRWLDDPPVDALDRLIAETRPRPVRALRFMGQSLGRITAISIAVWLVTMPLIMARFHLVSPIAVVLNPLLWLPVAVALLSGFTTLVVGPWIPPLGSISGWLCDRSLAVTEWSVGAMNELPGGHFYVPGPSDWWLAGFYFGCAAIALFPAVFTWPRRAALLAAWTGAGLLPAVFASDADKPLRCHCFAVGHGCAVLIELPDGRRMLYDAGQLGLPSAAARTIADALWHHGVTHLDALVISHADVDHYCAVPHLIERFSIAKVYVSSRMFVRETDALRALDQALLNARVPREIVDSRCRFRVGDDVQIEVLHPARQGVDGSDNANSIVLEIVYQGRRILLTGDLEPPGLEALLSEAPIDCDMLLAPHHGSRGSDPPGLIEWCSPEYVAISGSLRDVSASVAAAYAARGAQVFHTALDGAVSVTITRGELSVGSFRETNRESRQRESSTR